MDNFKNKIVLWKDQVTYWIESDRWKALSILGISILIIVIIANPIGRQKVNVKKALTTNGVNTSISNKVMSVENSIRTSGMDIEHIPNLRDSEDITENNNSCETKHLPRRFSRLKISDYCRKVSGCNDLKFCVSSITKCSKYEYYMNNTKDFSCMDKRKRHTNSGGIISNYVKGLLEK